jgi:predicted HAD superfamily Cof-like phosphohydrolase
MNNFYLDVNDFHNAFKLKVGDEAAPAFSDDQSRALRIKLMREEVEEYLEGEDKNDLANVAKELADIVYIACGTAVEYGIPLDIVFDAVHKSNMEKLVDGEPVYRDDGKVMKPTDWQAPDIKKILDNT